MATNALVGGALSWLEVWKTIAPDNGMADIYNETTEMNTIFAHSMWMEANDGSTHTVARTASLPTSSIKRTGIGTAPTSGSTVNAVEETMVRELWIEVEDEELNNSPNPEALIQYHIKLGVQAITQDSVQDWVYGNRGTSPETINGFFVRHGSIQTDRKQGRVLSATGSSNANSSILGMKWGEDGIYMTFPVNHPTAGIDVVVSPLTDVTDSSGNITKKVRIRIQFAYGIVEKNRRNIFRLANIDASITSANWITLVENNLITLCNDAPNDAVGFRLYGNNFVKTNFDIRAKDKTNVYYNPMGNYIGQPPGQTAMFNGIPFYKVERFIGTEANVV